MFPVKNKIDGDTQYAGRSVARVIDNVDPKKRGRIRVFHPYLGESTWIDYLRVPGQFFVPEIEDLVYIEADAGWISHPIAWGNVTAGEDSDLAIPEEFQRFSPTNRGLFSPDGHVLELDDGTGITGTTDKGIRITSSEGKKLHIAEDTTTQDNRFFYEDENSNLIEVDAVTNTITINTSNGASFVIDGTTDSLTASTSSGEELSLSSTDGISLTSAQATVTIDTTGNIEVSGPSASLSMANSGEIELANSGGSLKIAASGQVELAGASDGVVALLQELAQTLSTDTFPGFGAPAASAPIYAQIASRAAAILAS